MREQKLGVPENISVEIVDSETGSQHDTDSDSSNRHDPAERSTRDSHPPPPYLNNYAR